jgi:hypothetical protein
VKAPTDRAIARALALLVKRDHALRGPRADGRHEVVGPTGAPLMLLAAATADALRREGLVDAHGRATSEGAARLRRSNSRSEPFAAQHRAVERVTIEDEGGERRIDVNLAESPLAWLRSRRGRGGAPLIGDAQFAAGERLRRDATRAAMTPSVTSRWDLAPTRARRDGGRLEPSDAILAARAKVERALEAVGPELAGLLLDVCFFLKGLETVERERDWPPRSARVVLGVALDRLARHYGLIAPPVDAPARPDIRHWRDPTAKPRVMPPTEG